MLDLIERNANPVVVSLRDQDAKIAILRAELTVLRNYVATLEGRFAVMEEIQQKALQERYLRGTARSNAGE